MIGEVFSWYIDINKFDSTWNDLQLYLLAWYALNFLFYCSPKLFKSRQYYYKWEGYRYSAHKCFISSSLPVDNFDTITISAPWWVHIPICPPLRTQVILRTNPTWNLLHLWKLMIWSFCHSQPQKRSIVMFMRSAWGLEHMLAYLFIYYLSIIGKSNDRLRRAKILTDLLQSYITKCENSQLKIVFSLPLSFHSKYFILYSNNRFQPFSKSSTTVTVVTIFALGYSPCSIFLHLVWFKRFVRSRGDWSVSIEFTPLLLLLSVTRWQMFPNWGKSMKANKDQDMTKIWLGI